MRGRYGEQITVGHRRAHVGDNAVAVTSADEGEYAVFMFTLYNGRWYYDGYLHRKSLEEAIHARDDWVNGGAA